jgi:flagellar hook protein FlgE
MIRSLNSGVSGIHQFQSRLDVIGNNIANSNTIAFKSGRADFGDAFSQTLLASSGSTGGLGSLPGQQIGAGVTTTAIRNLFSAGAVSQTGVDTDLALAGEGFFMVRDPITSNEFATRAGNFRRDDAGFLVTSEGFRLQGFSDMAGTTRGDIKIDAEQRPEDADADAAMRAFNITPEGLIQVSLEGSSAAPYTRAQILLQNFRDPQALLKAGNNLYTSIAAAGPLGGADSPTTAAPGTNGLGKITAGSLELSNVDLTNEFANLITTQRGFQASARIITTSDEVLQEVVNLKR